jgi:hypothetical protein
VLVDVSVEVVIVVQVVSDVLVAVATPASIS